MTLWAFSACKKMDSTYREFIVPGGITYTQKITSPKAFPGHNRIKISWLRGSDPNVTKVRIFWNNYADSVEVPLPAKGDTIGIIIDKLPEKTYSLIIKTYDSAGNSSVPVEVLSAVYGEQYQASLRNRPISSSIMNAQGIVTTQWGDADISNGAFATEVIYTNTSGVITTQRVGVDQPSSVISDYKTGTMYQFRTIYLPGSSSIDTFYTAFIKDQIVSKSIDKSNWTATADSYAPTSLLPNGGSPQKAIDDNTSTFWHSVYPSTTVIYPHWLAVDMKRAVNVSSVELTYRQDVFNSFTDFMIMGSLDGVSWTTYGTFNFKKINSPQSFSIPESPKMQYVKIYATKGTNAYAHLAELTVYGY